MAMKIAVLEDNLDRREAMRVCLKDRFSHFDLRFFAIPKEMTRFFDDHLSETIAISLDHDLDLQPEAGRLTDPGTGREVADYLAGHHPVCPVILHSTNSLAASGMELVLREAGWQTFRVVPFDDLVWIATDWFRAMRRAIVGPVKKAAENPF
jgi:hypothetical protein